MNRLATASVTAVTAIGIFFAPQQAAADTDDLAKAIAGIAAVAIIAKVIDDRKDRKTEKSSRAGRLGTARTDDHRLRNDRGIIDGRIRPHDRHERRTQHRGFKRHPLPQQCLRIVETSRGDRTAYLTHCLNRNYRFASRLPGSCETLVRTRNGLRSVFGVRCLARDGWNVARK